MADDNPAEGRRKQRVKKAKKPAAEQKARKTSLKKSASSRQKRRSPKLAKPARGPLAMHAIPTLTETRVTNSQPTEIILLPPRGLRADSSSLSFGTQGFMASLHEAANMAKASERMAARMVLGASVPQLKKVAPNLKMQVLDSIAENGAKLLMIAPADLARIRRAQPGLRFAPLLKYELPLSPRALQIHVLAGPAARTAGVRFSLVSSSSRSRGPGSEDGWRAIQFSLFIRPSGSGSACGRFHQLRRSHRC